MRSISVAGEQRQRRLVVAFTFGGSSSQLGSDEQTLDLQRRQLAEALALAADRELIRRQDDGAGVRIVAIAKLAVHGRSVGSAARRFDDGRHGFAFGASTTSSEHISFSTFAAARGSPRSFASRPAPKTSVRMSFEMPTQPPGVS